MTREDEIRKRLEKATPGDWKVSHRNVTCTEFDDEKWGLGLEIEGPPEAENDGQFARAADAQLIANAPSDLRYLLEKVERLEREIDDMATDRLDYGDPILGAIRSCPFASITFRYNPEVRELSINASQGPNRKAQRELQDRDIAAHRKASAFVAHEIIRTVEEAYAKKEPTDAT